MNNDTDRIFSFVPLTDYSFKKRLSIRLADVAFYAAIRFLGATVKFEVEGMENLTSISDTCKLPIYAFWHDRIFLSTYFFRKRKIVVMTSKSFDGEYIARFIQRLGYGAIRGSSSRGGSKALVKMIKAMRNGLAMAFTVDGPRGTKYEAKAGPILLAKKTGNPILPFVVEPQKFWTAKSWDKMHIPKPFTKALVSIGKPIYVSASAGDEETSLKLSELQRSLDELVKRGRVWREGSNN